MAYFLTVAAKHCRQAEHSLQLAAGSFNIFWQVILGEVNNGSDERRVLGVPVASIFD
jgi:hypothetical protein